MSLQIYAVGGYYGAVADALPDLKALVQEATGEPVRRIGRFIQLALIGAGRCARGQQLPADTAVYFSSGRGDLETTVDVMTALFRDGQSPKPLSFVNTVSNAACFYVARSLKLQSRSNFVCNRYFAFESVLQLAALDIDARCVDSALVGSVDVAMTPLHEHRRRIQLAADLPIAEGSHWLWLGSPHAERPRLGELVSARPFATREALLEWMKQEPALAGSYALSAGQFIDDADFNEIRRVMNSPQLFDYRSQHGYYDSQSGAAVAAFLASQAPYETLLHINADPARRYQVMLVQR